MSTNTVEGGRRGVVANLERLRERISRSEYSPHPAGDRSPLLARLLFLAAVVGYPIQQWMAQPRYVGTGAMWAEMATNYYRAAHDAPWQSLLATDAGYLPLPQRLIALVGVGLNLTPSTFAFYFTFTALILSAMLIGVVCLPRFRPLISSDLTRFVLAVSVLLIADFEARTFINFTYFAAFFIAAVACLMLVSSRLGVPWYAWTIPLLLISKPTVLIVVPLLVFAGILATKRFKVIVGLAMLAVAAQIVQLLVTTSTGPSPLYQGDSSASAWEKLTTAAAYSAGYLGKTLVGMTHFENAHTALILVGALAIAAAIAGTWIYPSPSWAAVWGGICLLVGNSLLVAFTFSSSFGSDLGPLSWPGFERRTYLAFAGGFLLAAGFVDILFKYVATKLARPRAWIARASHLGPVVLLVAWIAGSGWAHYMVVANAARESPVVGNSLWSEKADQLRGDGSVCIPIDPWGWGYGNNCEVLIVTATWVQPMRYDSPKELGTPDGLVVPVPAEVKNASLASISFLARTSDAPGDLMLRVIIVDEVGEQTVGATAIDPNKAPGIVEIDLPSHSLGRIESIFVMADPGVELAFPSGTPEAPAVLYMGTPAN